MRIIQSKLLTGNQELIHGISTRTGGSPPFYNNLSKHVGDDEAAVKLNRDKFFGDLGIDQTRLVHANQVHSCNVRIVTEPGLYRDTDGLITSEKNLFLVISVADCLPVMIYDEKNQIAGNIHAGWRGTYKKIVSRAVEFLISKCGSKAENLKIFLGPCIGRQNFEVGSDVADMFDGKFVMKATNRYYVDIIADNTEQLEQFGIKKNQIETSGLCTFENVVLHSYRRDQETSGRMFAVIGIRV